jgi:hypothetical protein
MFNNGNSGAMGANIFNPNPQQQQQPPQTQQADNNAARIAELDAQFAGVENGTVLKGLDVLDAFRELQELKGLAGSGGGPRILQYVKDGAMSLQETVAFIGDGEGIRIRKDTNDQGREYTSGKYKGTLWKIDANGTPTTEIGPFAINLSNGAWTFGEMKNGKPSAVHNCRTKYKQAVRKAINSFETKTHVHGGIMFSRLTAEGEGQEKKVNMEKLKAGDLSVIDPINSIAGFMIYVVNEGNPIL